MRTKIKFFILLVLTAFSFNNAHASVSNDSTQVVSLRLVEMHGSVHSPHKSPVVQPQIGIEDYTLFIYSGCEDATLILVDENDNEVFSQEIEEDTDQIVLPSTLSGTYEIRIYRGNYMFYGEIEL